MANAVRSVKKMRLLPLIAATYFMVAGAPTASKTSSAKPATDAPCYCCSSSPSSGDLPTSLMVGELASAIPEEGGYYCWVRRALGRFWGFQEAWLSLAASIFDMAIYPVIFVLYLGRLEPAWTAGSRGTLWALVVVVLCAAWNLRGARAVGEGSIGLFVLLLAPFVVLIFAAMWHIYTAHAGEGFPALLRPIAAPDLAGAVCVALWNYMGWDNASTVAQEVEDPQRNYPRAMLASAGLVALTYVLPLAAVGLAGIPADRFSTGAWTDAARTLAGPWLALAVVIGGTINGFGMFNALMLSYTRVPYALAEEACCQSSSPSSPKPGVPWVSVLLCALCWALALRLSSSASSPSTSSSTEPPSSWSSSPWSSCACANPPCHAHSASPEAPGEQSPSAQAPHC